MKVIDGSAFVNIYRPKTSKTFREYCDVEIVNIACSLCQGVERIDFVFDRCLEKTVLNHKLGKVE